VDGVQKAVPGRVVRPVPGVDSAAASGPELDQAEAGGDK
jgi:hypothetical protein